VHDTEALNEQVLTLKKQLASSHAENKLLRVAKERMEVELRRAEHDGEQALRTGGLVEGVGPTAARPEVRLLHALKAKTRELQDELQAKEVQIGELSGQTRGVRVKELEIQAKVYLEEARRLRELFDRQASEHADAEQALRERHSYELAVKEQELEALRQERSRLKKQNGAIDEELGRWMDENEVLRERVHALESAAGPGASSGGGGGAAAIAAPLVPTLPSEVVTLKAKLREALMRQKTLQKDKERAEADKLAIFQELNEANLRLEAELKQERTKARRFERMHHAAASDLALAQAELLRATRS
jgi:DNA repair exonuclease SbcCD ATPase subunit